MNNYYPASNKTIVYCSHCVNKMRVPVDKGKITVTCPLCRKEFLYNPNSILHTLKHAALSIVYIVPKHRRKQALMLLAALCVIIALVFFFVNRFSHKSPDLDPVPGQVVYWEDDLPGRTF